MSLFIFPKLLFNQLFFKEMWILRKHFGTLMWTKKAFLNGFDIRRFSCGGMLLGSILLTNQTSEEQKKPWKVEYPKVAMKNDVLLSRKVISRNKKKNSVLDRIRHRQN